MGGVSQGTIRKEGRYHIVTALAVDSDPVAEQTHALSMPHIPTVCYKLANTEDSLALLYRYVPKALMGKTYIHASNSCRQASTGNFQNRDIDRTHQDTDWFLSLLEQTGCAIWTLETSRQSCSAMKVDTRPRGGSSCQITVHVRKSAQGCYSRIVC